MKKVIFALVLVIGITFIATSAAAYFPGEHLAIKIYCDNQDDAEWMTGAILLGSPLTGDEIQYLVDGGSCVRHDNTVIHYYLREELKEINENGKKSRLWSISRTPKGPIVGFTGIIENHKSF